MPKTVQITIDCSDPAALAAFWAQALDYEVQGPPPGFDSWDDALQAFGVPPDQRNSRSAVIADGLPRVFFQRVPEGRTGKNRLHLDVRAAPGLVGDERMEALEAEAARLEAIGARRAYRVEPDGRMEHGFITMHDPEGNEFCLD
ncbi:MULTISPECIES: VOC family protein [Aeromicrobium]|uniref:VOC family protein n=1 Tax=Aeromicrobium TaxID=2040 RepID=UPI0006F9DB9D|nr:MULTISPECIES: VOC family protein [Aeromicrobium]KQX75278.1 glyoxalase [Aeromicrobium sp. Root472D3]MCL8251248.1 VOC family protein [Aeromicrobium fastidiosum]